MIEHCYFFSANEGVLLARNLTCLIHTYEQPAVHCCDLWECDLCEAGGDGHGDNPLDLAVGDLFI